MDKRPKLAYILSGLVLIYSFYHHVNSIHLFAAPISIVLLILSIRGSLRARLALIGFLLFFVYTYYQTYYFVRKDIIDNIFREITMFPTVISFLKMKIFIPDSILHHLRNTISFLNFLVAIAAVILLFRSIDIEETSSRFSEKTSLLPTALLLYLLASLSFFWMFIFPLFDFSENMKYIRETGFPVIPFIISLALMAAYIFIAVFLQRKKAVGYILAPIVLIMIILNRINHVIPNDHFKRLHSHLGQLFRQDLSGTFEMIIEGVGYVFLIRYSVALILTFFGAPLVILFILCLREDTLGIVGGRLKDES